MELNAYIVGPVFSYVAWEQGRVYTPNHVKQLSDAKARKICRSLNRRCSIWDEAKFAKNWANKNTKANRRLFSKKSLNRIKWRRYTRPILKVSVRRHKGGGWDVIKIHSVSLPKINGKIWKVSETWANVRPIANIKTVQVSTWTTPRSRFHCRNGVSFPMGGDTRTERRVVNL